MTFYTGTPVYPPLDWKSAVGIICPIAIVVGAIALFVGFFYCTRKKLRAYEIDEVIKIMEGTYEVQVDHSYYDTFGVKSHNGLKFSGHKGSMTLGVQSKRSSLAEPMTTGGGQTGRSSED